MEDYEYGYKPPVSIKVKIEPGSHIKDVAKILKSLSDKNNVPVFGYLGGSYIYAEPNDNIKLIIDRVLK